METWKTAGWVPDSDEEDLELATPPTAPTTTPVPSTVTQRNDAQQPGKQTDVAGALNEVRQQDVERKRAEESDEDELAGPAPVRRTVKRVCKKKLSTHLEQKEGGPTTSPKLLASEPIHESGTPLDNEVDTTRQIESPAAFEEPQGDEPDRESAQNGRDSNTEAAVSEGPKVDSQGTRAPVKQDSEHPTSDGDVAALDLASTPIHIGQGPSLGSSTSSPLTVASRSPDAPPTWNSPRNTQNMSFAPQVVIPMSLIPDLQLDNESERSLLDFIQSERRSGRSLRDRTAIQLRPYMLEAQQYKKNMHARGVKATIVQPSSSQNSDSKSDEDDSQPFEPSLQKSPRAPRPRSARADDSASFRVEWDPYELPDVEDILNGRDGPVPRPKKRRKLIHPLSSKARNSTIEDNVEQGVDSLPTPRNSSSTADPLSSGLKRLKGRHGTKTPLGFRHPPTIPSMQMQTPSSSVETSDQPQAPGSSPPISTMKRRRLVRRVESDSSDDQAAPSSSDAEERAAKEAAVWRRKLTGVLPASYTTLSAKVPQAKDKAKTAKARSGINAAPTAKGVARPVSSHRRSPSKGTQQSPIIFSDDITPPGSPSPGTGGNAAPAGQAREVLPEEEFMNWPDTDDMEDDAIDFMPHVNANRKRPKSAGSLQAKPRKRLRQSTISGQVRQNARQSTGQVRKRPKQLGILDAERGSPQSRKPNFVKVAARTARARQDQGRGSPSRKVFRLHQAADNEEVQNVLRDWKDSFSDKHADADSDIDRPMPLWEISGNHQAPIEISDGDEYKRLELVQKRKPRAKTSSRPKQRQRTAGVKAMQDALRGVAAKRSIISSMKSSRTPANVSIKPGVGAPTQNVRVNAQAGPGQLSVPVLDDEPPPVLRQGNAGPLMAIDRLPLLKHYEEQPAELRQVGVMNEWMFRPRKRLVRKRPPRQTVLPIGQPDDGYDTGAELVYDDAPNESARADLRRSHGRQIIFGLESWAQDADVTFEIKPLPTGILFPSSSFVGSGRFGRCIGSPRNHSQQVDADEGESSSRPSWNDRLRGDLTSRYTELTDFCLARSISETAASHSLCHLETIATLMAQGLSFPDSVDRASFVQHVLHLTNNTLQCLPDSDQPREASLASETVLIIRIQLASRLALIGHKLIEECNRGSVPYDLIGKVEKSFQVCVQDCLSQISKIGCPILRRFLRRCNDLSLPQCEKATSVAEAYVITRALSTRHEARFGDVWKNFKSVDRFDASHLPQDPKDINIARLEQQWRDMFTLLPFENVDLRGQVSSNPSTSASNWAFVKALMKPVLQAYRVGSCDEMGTCVAYCRAIFSRCFALVRQWRWQKCGPIIGFAFDFFAKNGLANLGQESCHCSPTYLQKLSAEPELDIETGDCCFHLFLKLVGAGVRSMYNSILEKDMRSVVWRILPNHDRHFPKAQEPRIADLDATRNQHDLLCTLFWAAPPSCRPDLKYLVKLVQDDSHASVYEINTRSWLNLVHYQIHCDCTNAATSPFAHWHDELLGRLLRQHASVRAEIEDEARRAEERNGHIFSEITKEQTIAKNQRQVESSLLDLLKSLALAVSKCPSPESASGLITAKLGRVFDLFDSKQARLHQVLIEALKSVSLAATHGQISASTAISALEDDSQGLDWSGFDDLDELNLPVPEPIFVEEVYTSLHSCLSSVFAASPAPSDELLRCLTDTWSDVSLLYVKRGIKSWDNYFGQYGRDTWTVLADTEQTRRFAPYLWARLLEHDATLWRSQRLLILRTWLASLTDREAQLKYQGDFTASILNLRCGDPLLANLPLFCNADGRFAVPVQSLQQRRLAILDTVLANMRRTIAADACAHPAARTERKEEYKVLLEELMLAMKTRYQELGMKNESQNSYVKFVHAVVKSLQEQVHDLCTLDPFFTSSAAFPLPAGDPMYVASKIKAYGLRLGEPMVSKRLATFLGSILERAVHDRDVDLMIRQLHSSVCAIEDQGAQNDLRSFLIREFLPVYVRASISHPCGWLFTVPLLVATGSILSDALYTVDGCNAESLSWHLGLCSVVLTAMRTALDIDNMFTVPVPVHLAKILIATFGMVGNSLPLLTYIFELGRGTQEILNFLEDLCAASEKIQGLSLIGGLDIEKTTCTGGTERNATKTDLQNYVKRDLDSTLSRSRHENGMYLIARGGIWKNVQSVHDTAPMQQELLQSVTDFTNALKRSSAFEYLM